MSQSFAAPKTAISNGRMSSSRVLSSESDIHTTSTSSSRTSNRKKPSNNSSSNAARKVSPLPPGNEQSTFEILPDVFEILEKKLFESPSESQNLSLPGVASPKLVLLDNPDESRAVIDRLINSKVVAIDFEGIHVDKSGKQRCSIMHASTSRNSSEYFIFDLQALSSKSKDIGGVLTLLYSPTIKLIFDFRSDVASLHLTYPSLVDKHKFRNLFDVQILWSFNLSIEKGNLITLRPGLGALVRYNQSLLGIHATEATRYDMRRNKAIQLMGSDSDIWFKRPLRKALKEYCVDSRFLFSVVATVFEKHNNCKSKEFVNLFINESLHNFEKFTYVSNAGPEWREFMFADPSAARELLTPV